MSSRVLYMKGGIKGGNWERATAGRGPTSDVLHFGVDVQPAKYLEEIEEAWFFVLGKIPSEDGTPKMLSAIHVKVISDPSFLVSGTSE